MTERLCIEIYIYIYIILHGIVCDAGFHAITNRQTEWKSFKKKKELI